MKSGATKMCISLKEKNGNTTKITDEAAAAMFSGELRKLIRFHTPMFSDTNWVGRGSSEYHPWIRGKNYIIVLGELSLPWLCLGCGSH